MLILVFVTVYFTYVNFVAQQTIVNPKASSGVENIETSVELSTVCTTFTGGVVTPLKDRQVFTDNSYTEVTITSREAWDKSKLPKKVLELEKENYTCSPMPLEFKQDNRELAINAQPAVTSVEWSCELEYKSFNYKYLNSQNLDHKNILEDQNFNCEKQACLDKGDKEDFVWLCVRT